MSQPGIETDSSFLSFLNPRIYLISILPALALFTPNQAGQGLRLVWATFSLVLLQHGVNLLNDLEDDRRGADDNKSDSWIRHFKNSAILQKHGLAFFFSGIFLGLLCLLHFQNLGVVLWSAPFVWAAWAYNKSDKPISYSRFSEWVTAACYGPGVVVSLALLCNQSLNLRTISLSLAFAALAAAVLLAHQIPQISDDQKVSKQSFALRHGARTPRGALLAANRVWRPSPSTCCGAARTCSGRRRAVSPPPP